MVLLFELVVGCHESSCLWDPDVMCRWGNLEEGINNDHEKMKVDQFGRPFGINNDHEKMKVDQFGRPFEPGETKVGQLEHF
jgi:hypothetical protein